MQTNSFSGSSLEPVHHSSTATLPPNSGLTAHNLFATQWALKLLPDLATVQVDELRRSHVSEQSQQVFSGLAV